MIRNFTDVLENAKRREKKSLAVLQPRSKRVFTAVDEAKKMGLISPVLIDTRGKSHDMLSSFDIDRRGYELVEVDDPVQIMDEALRILHGNGAHMIFQGDTDSKYFLETMTHKNSGMAQINDLSYVSLFELPAEKKLILLTDTFIQEFPDLRQKAKILTNAISFAGILGIEKPHIAALTMHERVNISVPSSMDAAVLSKMSERGQFDAVIDGPLDIDCASSPEKALRKGINSPVSGKVDIYLLPDIESGYCIAEVMTFLGRTKPAGTVLGSKFPVILNIKFEPVESILIDIALSMLRIL